MSPDVASHQREQLARISEVIPAKAVEKISIDQISRQQVGKTSVQLSHTPIGIWTDVY